MQNFYLFKPSKDVKVSNHGFHIQLTKEESSSETGEMNIIQRLTGELQEGSTDMDQTWHISCEVSLYHYFAASMCHSNFYQQ